jgi:RimJ/RimL family protein N-acetyltransferase
VFAKKHDYFEVMRAFESRLDVRAFDFEPWREAEHKPKQHGIEIKTLAELSQTEPDWGRKLWEMESVSLSDIPVPDPIVRVPYEFFQTKVLQDPHILLNGWFVAVDEQTGEWAGSSALWKADGTYFNTGFTGVRREYRRKGIALALKLRAVRFAQEAGIPEIRTDNASANRPMLSINEALGFMKQPAWVEIALEFEPGGATAHYAENITEAA